MVLLDNLNLTEIIIGFDVRATERAAKTDAHKNVQGAEDFAPKNTYLLHVTCAFFARCFVVRLLDSVFSAIKPFVTNARSAKKCAKKVQSI